MTPTPSMPPDVRRDIVLNILHTVAGATRSNLFTQEIMGLGATVETFEPNDKDFLASQTQCLFEPISEKAIKPWKISATYVAESASSNITIATLQVFNFIRIQFSYRRQGKTYLSKTFGWDRIDFEKFCGGKDSGFLFSPSGKCRGVDTPAWSHQLVQEWWDGEILAGPSVRFVLCTDGIAEENSLLISELGAIAQVIEYRRTQPEFLTAMLFPVS
ncbi:uncharacterized protein N7515_002837 [Penicillium bovifimosum]|uniref:Uncharacterized protein n=1 Tax=Penicillium bovifimosum TaxID=126998 RepID=A0A9W9HC99_9EURO|nr:uncharacterized protein N7515_002837 [Penicillium bovifimosum]KAJ5144050.1 hypothetical protein N7515_002837 [Penicillium bovifimosum]